MKLKFNSHSAGRSAFTLIELLVVIAIISLLAGIGFPAMQQALMAGKQARALSDARQIGMALRMYGSDNDGAFPGPQSVEDESLRTSNDAFRLLVLGKYLESETVFTVPQSKAGPKADNRMETPAEAVARGENHWAYVAGLNTSSNSNWPLIVDHTDGSGFYSDQEADLGGTWKGRKGLVVRADGSAAGVQLKGAGRKRYLPRYNDPKLNALQVNDYMGKEAKLLEPAI